MMQEGLIHNFSTWNCGIIKIGESASLAQFPLTHENALFWNIDFYYKFNFRLFLIIFSFNFHGLFFLTFYMSKNYAPFFLYFVIITLAALSQKFLLSLKSQHCVYILTHALILPAFVLSCEWSKLTKIPLLSKVNKFICVTKIISYFTFKWYPTAN